MTDVQEDRRAAAVARAEADARMFQRMAADDDADARERIFAEIGRLGLERNVLELDLHGYTVVPNAAPPGLTEQLRDRLLDLSEQRTGIAPDRETGASHAGFSARGQTVNRVLFEGEVFERAIMNEISLALVTYLLGEHCVIGGTSGGIKGPGGGQVKFHTDQHTPQPYPAYAQTANATWILTDYTVEDGCLAMYVGSHKFCRMPKEAEQDVSDGEPVIAPAGSLIVWHGNQWHGAFPRTAPGLRVNLIQYFMRPYLRPFDDMTGDVEPLIERNGPRMARLLGDFLPSFDSGGYNYDRMMETLQACHNLYA